MTDAKFEPFEPTDLTPYIDQINKVIREAVEQYVAERDRQIAAFHDEAAPSAAPDVAEQGQDGEGGSEGATGQEWEHPWSDWVQRLIRESAASVEDIARNLKAMTATLTVEDVKRVAAAGKTLPLADWEIELLAPREDRQP